MCMPWGSSEWGTNVCSVTAKNCKSNSDGNSEIIVTIDLARPFSWKAILVWNNSELIWAFMLQLAGSAANTINSRFIKYYDNASLLPQQILSTPDSIFKSSIGLSTKRIEYIKDLSARIIDGRVNLWILPGMTDEEIVAQLRLEGGQQTSFWYFVLEDSVSNPLEIWA